MAATKTQLLGGAFQDSEGNPLSLGYLKMKLSQDASVSGVGNICSGIEITVQLDENGNVAEGGLVNVACTGDATITDGMYATISVGDVTPFFIGQSVQASGFSDTLVSINGQSGLTVSAIGTNTVTIQSHDLTNSVLTDQNAGVLTVLQIGLDTSVWANTGGVLSPVNTYYRVTGYTAAGQRAWGPNNQQVGSGATFNLGSWVPNSVISWFPTVSQFPALAVEVAGAPFSSPTLLDFESSDSSVTITDEGAGVLNFQASGGASFSGNGAYFFGPGITDTGSIYGTIMLESMSMSNYSGGQVIVYLFELLAPFTISKASQLALGSQFAVHAHAGIYSYAGNKLVDTGTFLYEAGSGIQTNTFTPVTLPAGMYWHAQATDTTSVGQWVGVAIPGGADAAITVLVKNSTRAAIAANVLGGTMPATLGTLTPFIPSNSNGDGIFCPLYE